MPFVPAINCAEVVINGSIAGEPIANVVGAQFPGPYVQSDLDNLANAVDAWVGSDYIPLFNAGVTYVNTHVRGLTSSVDIDSFASANGGVGTASGSALPANASLCMTLRSGHTGRSARGRFYAWPAIQPDLADLSHFTSSYATAMHTALSNLKAAIVAEGWAWVIISRQHNGVKLTVATTYPVIAIDARNLAVDSQRGRLATGH